MLGIMCVVCDEDMWGVVCVVLGVICAGKGGLGVRAGYNVRGCSVLCVI